MAGWTTEVASEKQLGFLSSLLSSRSANDDLLASATKVGMTKKEASAAIDALMKCPWKAAPTPAVEEGYYVVDETTIFVVVKAKNSDRRYAKRLHVPKDGGKAKWNYAPGAMAMLAGKSPMTLEEAAAFGHMHGYCIACGASLTDPKSVAMGIGPVCAKKFSGGAK